MKPDNSSAYFEWKKAERLAGRMNAPIRGPKGLARLVRERTHSLWCKCAKCAVKKPS